MTKPCIVGFGHIADCGVFAHWPKGNIQFGRYNIIYGWNGTGKTTLSRIFRSLELEQISPALTKNAKPSFQFQLADNKFVKSEILAGWKDNIRVFNKDFIRDNLHDDGNAMAPVFHLGKEQGDALSKLKDAQSRFVKATDASNKAQEKHADFAKAAAKRVSNIAGVVKETLSLPNFSAPKLKTFLEDIEAKGIEPATLIQAPAKLALLVNAARGTNDKDKLEPYKVPPLNAKALHKKISEVLKRNVITVAIEELDNDSVLKGWVDEGHTLHSDRDTCAYCNSKISKSRKEQLGHYFNEAYKALQSDIKEITEEMQSAANSLETYSNSQLYPLLQAEHKAFVNAYNTGNQLLGKTLESLSADLNTKLSHLSESLQPKTSLTDFIGYESAVNDAVKGLNKCIDKHNKQFEDFESSVIEARNKVIAHYTASFYAEFLKDKAEEAALQGSIVPLQEAATAASNECDSWEQKLQQHDIALPKLNDLLHAFIGRNDICLELNKTGYHVMRGKEHAENLSEGERTAIAFTYFIAKMEEKHFDLANGIVVVDDPISSLDSNSLYAAGAFIRCHLQKAKQLFVLTHNHQFFREIYGWVRKLEVKDTSGLQAPKGFFMLKCETKDGVRYAIPSKLEKILKDYDSEYVYLCSQLFENRDNKFDKENGDLMARLMTMPNTARRVLETFLLFKFPNLERNDPINLSSHIKKLSMEQFAPEKTTTLDRLLNRGSHGDETGMVTLNMMELSETAKVIGYVLDFIEMADGLHFQGLRDAIGIKSPVAKKAA